MMVRGQWGNLARMPHCAHFFEGHCGIFNDHRESGPQFNISAEGMISEGLRERLELWLLKFSFAIIGINHISKHLENSNFKV